MNAAMRQKLFNALTADILAKAEGSVMTERFVTEMANQDLDRLAPAVDKLLADREAELLKLMPCGHPIAEMELAPPGEQSGALVGANVETGILVIDARDAVYRCAGCRRQQEFVRKVSEHVGKIFMPCGEECSRPTAQTVEAQLASIT